MQKDLITWLLLTALFSGMLTSRDLLAEPGAKRMRARDAGVEIGVLKPGKWNAITDVAGVMVGHETVIQGDSVRTGVTVILPHGGNLFQEKVPAAVYAANAFGKLVGSTQVEELGEIESPIALTGTLNVPRVADALISYMLSLPGNEEVRSINVVVGETNDGYLNDIRGRHVTEAHVWRAIENARTGPVEEGNVGAGTGTRCLGFKGGIGTASRVLPKSLGGYTVGVLVQTNFGGILQINGAPVGRELGRFSLRRHLPYPDGDDGSCMIVVATDAPLTARNLKRLAKRAMLGLARTGGYSSNGSGDYVIAFSTQRPKKVEQGDRTLLEHRVLPNDAMSPLFLAVVEATEEAIINSLFMAETLEGYRGHRTEALPIDNTLKILEKYRALHQNKNLPSWLK